MAASKLTPEQERHLLAAHPDVAKRWIKRQGVAERKIKNANPESASNESNSPAVAVLAKLPGVKRDFKGLKVELRTNKGSAPNLVEADKQGAVEGMSQARKGKMNLPEERHTGLRRRDVKVAFQYGDKNKKTKLP